MHSRYTRPCWIRAWNQLIDFSDFTRDDAHKIYNRHYNFVRDIVSQQAKDQNNSKLLEYDIKDGWGPLCEFLEIPDPGIPMPRGNEKQVFVKRFEKALFLTLSTIVKRLCIVGVVAWVVVRMLLPSVMSRVG